MCIRDSLQPLYDALQDMIPAAKLKEYMELNIIQIAPLAFMRGRTLNDAVVILDEAQNTTAPVSYTHLDVYKRQGMYLPANS